MTMTTTEPAPRPARRSKVATATATQVGEHLSLTRQRVTALADVEHVLVRLPDGKFDLADCRHRYIEFLRNSRRAQKSEQDQAFLAEKVKALTIRNEQRLGQLVPREGVEMALDDVLGAFVTGLSSLSVRIGKGDLQLRRLVEREVFAVRQQVSRTLEDTLARREAGWAAEDAGATDADP